jgi:hypothetical protein
MQAIVTSPSPTCGCADAVRHREDTQSSPLTQVQAETHTSADITLVTAEGDKVTLSTDAVMQAAYTRYDVHGRLRWHGIKRHTETLQLASANDISLQIEGNLSDAERADIQQALGTIEQFAADFFDGKEDEAPNQIFNLSDLNTLRSIDATLELSQSVTVSQQTETRPVAAAPPGLEPNAAALEAQPSPTQHPKSLLDVILQAIDTARADVAQAQGSDEPSRSL